ncbi:14893_t:CDS:2 [Cetraspora pellucida]|uniref:14893_t:CDS:1 n=1 Tax=Cetraspora pellucida TaxID=1433469 RepID=A0A9N8ZX27_9GLOM|nr:14893_t:CDS:2 [Cetraspora pellucida]
MMKVKENVIKKKQIKKVDILQNSLTVYNDDKRPKILLNSQIPTDDVNQIYNPKSDGNCGFYALVIAIKKNKKNWNLVKLAMNNQLNKHMKIYKDWLGYNINLLKQILESQKSSCSSLFWFLSPDYAQLTVDTFSVPIAIFDEKDEQCTMFFPLESASQYISDSLYKPGESVQELSHNNKQLKNKIQKSQHKVRKLNSSIAQFKHKCRRHVSQIHAVTQCPLELKGNDIKTKDLQHCNSDTVSQALVESCAKYNLDVS